MVTTKVVEPTLPVVASVPERVLFPAEAVLGILIVQTKPPVPVVLIVDPESVPELHDVGVTVAPAKASVAEADGVNPVPVTTTESPVGPWEYDGTTLTVLNTRTPVVVSPVMAARAVTV